MRSSKRVAIVNGRMRSLKLENFIRGCYQPVVAIVNGRMRSLKREVPGAEGPALARLR